MPTKSSVRLTRYGASLRQSAHTHGPAHLSLVLAGALQEEFGRTEVAFQAWRVAVRPEEMRHAAAFSPNGALILTCAYPAQAPPIKAPYWSPSLSRAEIRSLVPLLLAGDGESAEAACDLVAIARDIPMRKRPSRWISAVREQLLEAPGSASLSEIAARAGRHRVHLSRSFLAAFGETPSVFRRRAMLERALCCLASGGSAAAAAAEAGFADQSHFNRACRDIYGATPGRLARAAVDVSSVQDKAF